MYFQLKKGLNCKISNITEKIDKYHNDAFDAKQAEIFQDLQFLQVNRSFRPNMRRRVEQRFDLSPRELYERYRFSKESVEDTLIPLLYPDGERALDDQGHPFTPMHLEASRDRYLKQKMANFEVW